VSKRPCAFLAFFEVSGAAEAFLVLFVSTEFAVFFTPVSGLIDKLSGFCDEAGAGAAALTKNINNSKATGKYVRLSKDIAKIKYFNALRF
jgi:hypothetical protein